MSLAGGYTVGDRVACSGRAGTVVGGPARAACIRLSVAVRYDDGRIADERVNNLELLVDGPLDDEEEEAPPPPVTLQPPPTQQEQQQMASESMWGEKVMPTAIDYEEEPLQAVPPAEYMNGDTLRPDEAYFEFTDSDGDLITLKKVGDKIAAKVASIGAVGYWEGFDESSGVYRAGGGMGKVPAESVPDLKNFLGAPEAPDSPDGLDEEGRFASQDAPGFGAEQALQAVRDKIYRNYADLQGAFRALDRSGNGYVTRGDFFQAMGDVFLANGFTEDDIYEVADHFDLNKDGYISYEEFVQLVEGGLQGGEAPVDQPESRSLMDDHILVSAVDKAIQKFKIVVDQRYSAIREAFLKMDRDRRGFLTPQNFAQALLAHGVALSPDELELAYSAFDREGKGVISYTDFCAVMTQRFQFGAHLDRQMFK